MGIKFKDRDGNVWSDIQAFAVQYCGPRSCERCALYAAAEPVHCRKWIDGHVVEAARIMGLEIIAGEKEAGACSTENARRTML